MNSRAQFYLLAVAIALFPGPELASSQIPTLWSKCHSGASEVFPMYSWRPVEEVLAKASKEEIQEFTAWTPDREVIRGDSEDVFLFIWARLDDRGEADIRELESKKLPWPDNGAPAFLKLRVTRDHDVLLRFFRSIVSDGHPDPFDIGVIRSLGLVPIQYTDETIAELRKYCHDTNPVMKKYCDPSSTKPEANGIYGEEMLEVQDMLEYRKTGVLPSEGQ